VVASGYCIAAASDHGRIATTSVLLAKRAVTMRALLAIPFMVVPLAGCAGGANLLTGGASFGTEVIARGIVGKIYNDGGLFGQDTSTINYTPQQNAQRAANNAAVPPRSDKGTTIIQQGGGYGGVTAPGYGGGYASAGYYPQPYGGGGYGYGPPPPPPYYGGGYGRRW
jgi:hypothetical protein